MNKNIKIKMKINLFNKIYNNKFNYNNPNNPKIKQSSKFNIFIITILLLFYEIKSINLNENRYLNKNTKNYIDDNKEKAKNSFIDQDNSNYFLIKNFRLLNVIYHPFDNEINSIYGTGNVLKDNVYKDYCHILCKTRCCSGNDIQKLKCLTITQCEHLLNRIKGFTLYIIFISYICFSIITSIIIFLIFY